MKPTRYFCYFNLHKKCWSLKNLTTGRVQFHRAKFVLQDCQFKVSEAGRQRVLREKRKNVHAGIVGIIADHVGTDINKGEPVRYNPYEMKSFQRNGEVITRSAEVHFFEDKTVRCV